MQPWPLSSRAISFLFFFLLIPIYSDSKPSPMANDIVEYVVISCPSSSSSSSSSSSANLSQVLEDSASRDSGASTWHHWNYLRRPFKYHSASNDGQLLAIDNLQAPDMATKYVLT